MMNMKELNQNITLLKPQLMAGIEEGLDRNGVAAGNTTKARLKSVVHMLFDEMAAKYNLRALQNTRSVPSQNPADVDGALALTEFMYNGAVRRLPKTFRYGSRF